MGAASLGAPPLLCPRRPFTPFTPPPLHTLPALRAEDLEAEFPSKLRGFLRKRSDQGFFKNWKKRWVVLSDRLLYYFLDEQSANPNGAFRLLPHSHSVGSAPSATKRHLPTHPPTHSLQLFPASPLLQALWCWTAARCSW